MKKILFTAFLFFAGLTATFAQAKISFDKLVNDFGTFSENNPVQKCTFTFTNTGDKPLVINQATASCGCTVANYTKTPIKPARKRQGHRHLQWKRQTSRSLQKSHYNSFKRSPNVNPHLHRGRHDRGKGKIIFLDNLLP